MASAEVPHRGTHPAIGGSQSGHDLDSIALGCEQFPMPVPSNSGASGAAHVKKPTDLVNDCDPVRLRHLRRARFATVDC